MDNPRAATSDSHIMQHAGVSSGSPSVVGRFHGLLDRQLGLRPTRKQVLQITHIRQSQKVCSGIQHYCWLVGT